MQNYDVLDSLPVDKNIPTPAEVHMVDMLFGQNKGTIEKFLDGTKDIIFLGIFFIIFSLPQVDDIIKKFFPSTSTSPYILIFVKSLVFMLCYFIFKNVYLVKK